MKSGNFFKEYIFIECNECNNYFSIIDKPEFYYSTAYDTDRLICSNCKEEFKEKFEDGESIYFSPKEFTRLILKVDFQIFKRNLKMLRGQYDKRK